MENFLFALNVTMPVFLVILLGWWLHRIGMLSEAFCKVANRYVFQCALPISLFLAVGSMDLYSDFRWSFCLFCFATTTVIFFGVWAGSWLFLKDRGTVGAFAQASARSSASILGIAFALNIYGDAGMVPMMIVAAVPFFNIYSVLILTFSPHVDEAGRLLPPSAGGMANVRRAVKGVLTNPIILGILAGLPFALLRWHLPTMLNTALETISDTATPIALLVIGSSFVGSEALKKWKLATVSSFIKLFLLPGLCLPLALWMGFHGSEMVAILIMAGSPTTPACYVMARQMQGDGTLTANAVVVATLLSSVSITLWLFLLRTLGAI